MVLLPRPLLGTAAKHRVTLFISFRSRFECTAEKKKEEETDPGQKKSYVLDVSAKSLSINLQDENSLSVLVPLKTILLGNNKGVVCNPPVTKLLLNRLGSPMDAQQALKQQRQECRASQWSPPGAAPMLHRCRILT